MEDDRKPDSRAADPRLIARTILHAQTIGFTCVGLSLMETFPLFSASVPPLLWDVMSRVPKYVVIAGAMTLIDSWWLLRSYPQCRH
jgi:hypothetical protein